MQLHINCCEQLTICNIVHYRFDCGFLITYKQCSLLIFVFLLIFFGFKSFFYITGKDTRMPKQKKVRKASKNETGQNDTTKSLEMHRDHGKQTPNLLPSRDVKNNPSKVNEPKRCIKSCLRTRQKIQDADSIESKRNPTGNTKCNDTQNAVLNEGVKIRRNSKRKAEDDEAISGPHPKKKKKTYIFDIELDISMDTAVVVNVTRKKNAN